VILSDIIGTLAAILTTVAFLPQTIKVLRDKDTKAISLAMYIVFTLGVCLWLIYGILLLAWPIIIANIFTLILAMIILITKIKNG
jgi:MtN3 and saliva related transmembrane protein